MIENSTKVIKKKMKKVVIIDCAETKYGDVFFTLDNQPLLVKRDNIMGLNWNYQEHKKIINEALREIEGANGVS